MSLYSHSETRSWNTIPKVTQAGIMCNDRGFRRYLAHYMGLPGSVITEGEAADMVREFCGVSSRTELEGNLLAGFRWLILCNDYRRWPGEEPHADSPF